MSEIEIVPLKINIILPGIFFIQVNSSSLKMEPVVIVHGGAGNIADDKRAAKMMLHVKIAALKGYKQMNKNDSSLEAVLASVCYMEDNELFNAGYGSVLNDDGEVEMDASIMLGDSRAGAVTIVKNVKNPILLAKEIMESTKHVLLGGQGALDFAIKQGLDVLPPNSLVTQSRQNSLNEIKKGRAKAQHETCTVGAVAINSLGQLAAATSTGGLEGKMVGRCSDTSLLGCGSFADDEFGAVSTTGHGETIMKYCLAHSIVKEIEHGFDASTATSMSIQKMTEKLNNTAGAITLSSTGDVGVSFSTPRMPWAYAKNKKLYFGIDQNELEFELMHDSNEIFRFTK